MIDLNSGGTPNKDAANPHIEQIAKVNGHTNGQTRRTRVWWLLPIVLIVALVGWYAWNQYHAVPTVRVITPPAPAASAASAPEAAASAPALAASQAQVPVLPPIPAPIEPTRRTYTVKPGDILSRIFPKKWRQVCQDEGLISCDRITLGQEFKIPEGEEPTEKRIRAKKAAPKPSKAPTAKASKPHRPAPRIAAPKKELSCIKLGASPFNPEHSLSRALQGIDLLEKLPPEKKEIAKRKITLGEKRTEKELVGTQVFGEMLYKSKKTGKIMHVYDKPICTPEQGGQPEVMDTYDLGDGYILADPLRCGNPSWFILLEEKTVFVPPPPQAEPPAAPPAPPSPPAEPIAEPPRVVELPPAPRKKYWETAEKLYVGGDFDRHSSSYFVNGAFYPIVSRQPWGRFLFGGAIEYSQWEGTNRGFAFDGYKSLPGLEARWQLDTGHDASVAILGGHITERGSQGDYAMDRSCKVVGPSIAYSNYVRELRGEKVAPEFSAFLSVAFSQGCEGDHTWQGQPIADKAQLLRLNKLVQAGFRIIVLKTEKFRLYAQVGFFEEDPGARSASVRFGISDKYKIIFVGAGWNFDLLNGGNEPAWGFAIDAMRGIYVYRNHVLEQEAMAAVVKAGGAVHNGIVFVATPAEPIVPVERPD